MATVLRTRQRVPTIAERNLLVTGNSGLVGYVVGRLAARDSVDPEELYSWGMEGLVQAAHSFDGSRGLSFATYAIHRIRGRILDELRRADPLPRPLRTLVKKAAQCRIDLSQSLGREPTRPEMAAALELSEGQLTRVEQATLSAVVSLERSTTGESGDYYTAEPPDTDTHVDPEEAAERADLGRRLREAIRGLSPRHRVVLQRCYVDEEPLSTIGAQLGVSPSRVSQIHREAVLLLRSRLLVGEPEAA
jgi:RNA polymerase sigma factor FliA